MAGSNGKGQVVSGAASKGSGIMKMKDFRKIAPGCEVKLVEVDPRTGDRKKGERPFMHTAGYGSTALATNICGRTITDLVKGSGTRVYKILETTWPEASLEATTPSTAADMQGSSAN